MAYPGLAHEEHKYLGKEYCTGYTDVYGKWNTGFYCPQYGSKTAVFCCGTAVFKYCCTNQEPVDSSGVLLEGDDPNFGGDGVSSAVFVRVPIVFGVVCGIAAVLILLIVAACYFCSCCFAYKKRRDDPRDHHSLPTSLYRTSNSTTSNLLNLYSPAALTTNSLVTTPLDLDWAALAHATGPSSIASSYQSQQLYPTLQYPPGGNNLTPAIAAAALSQRSSHSPSPSSLLYSSACGGVGVSTPSVISGTAPNNRFQPSNPALSAYHNFLNSSTSTLASRPGVMAPPAPPTSHGALHRGNLPQQISTTASIVNSYLQSLQQAQAQLQSHTSPEQPPPLPPHTQPAEQTRHPSPPPPYFQIAPSYQPGNNRNTGGRNYPTNNNSQNNRTRMANVQSILGGGIGGPSNISGNSGNEEDLADFLLRNEDYLRRTLRLGTQSNNQRNERNATGANNATARSQSNSRGNSMLTQRELIELLLRLTYSVPPSSSSTTSISRSESRAGSDNTSTTSRSTTSSLKSAATASTTASYVGGNNPGGKNPPSTKFTISEVDEDDDRTTTSIHTKASPPPGLDLTLSRISDSDSGVPSSTCSTAGSEASAVIGSIKVIPRDISEEAVKLNKQHALDDDGDHLPLASYPPPPYDHHDDDNDLGGNKKLHQQQLAAIHPERNCTSPTTNNTFTGSGRRTRSDGEVIMESSTPSLIQDSDDGNHNVESGIVSAPNAPASLMPIGPCENAISSPAVAQVMQ